MTLVHFVSQSHRSHRAAWHIASHRGCVRAWLGLLGFAGRQGGHKISSASVMASKIAAMQRNRVYLATMQSLWVTTHRGLHGAAAKTPPKRTETSLGTQ